MGSKTAILSVRILTDAKDAKKGLDETASSVDKFQGKLNAMTPAAAGALGGILLLANKSKDAASALQQAGGANASVFKGYAGEMESYAKKAATNTGLAQSSYLQMGSVLGAQLKNMGMPMEGVAKQTDGLISLGADLAATFGGTTADAVAALSSLMRGEADPIERYGVSIKKSDINARLAAQGLTGLEGEALKAAETQAMLAMLTEQTADAQGQFARETDTAAGSAAIASARWEDTSAKLGTVLLPIVAAGAALLSDLAGWMGENSTVATILIGTIAALAAGVLVANGALRLYTAGQLLANSSIVLGTAAKVKDIAQTVILKAMYGVDMINALVSFMATKALELAAWGAGTVAKGKDLAATLLLKAMYGVDMVKALATFIASKGLELAAWTASTAAATRSTAAHVLSKTAIVAGSVAMGVATAAQWAWNVAMTANPIGLIIAAIAALIAIIVLVVMNWGTISRVAGEVWANVIQGVKNVIAWLNLGPTLQAIGNWFSWLGGVAAGIWNWIIGGIQGVSNWIVSGIVGSLQAVGSWFNWLGGLAAGIWNWVISGVQGIIDVLGTAIDWVRSFADSIANGVGGWISNIFGWGGVDGFTMGVDVAHAGLGGDAAAGPDGTGGWPTWAARSSHSSSSSSADIKISVSGAEQPEKTAAKVAAALDEFFRRNGQLPAGGVSWQPS